MCEACAALGTAEPGEVVDLAVRCGSTALAQLESLVEQLARANRLLRESFGQLREHFVGALASDDDAQGRAGRERHLQAAMVALQCEDTVGQMIDGIGLRSARLAEILRAMAPAAAELALEAAVETQDAASRKRIACRLQASVEALNDTVRLAPSVNQTNVCSGPIEFF